MYWKFSKNTICIKNKQVVLRSIPGNTVKMLGMQTKV
jgi:hypothetical protein